MEDSSSTGGKPTFPLPGTAALLDDEAAKEMERRAAISRVALEIESILLREDFTMGDFLEIVELFNGRANSVFAETKIKNIKDTYDRRS